MRLAAYVLLGDPSWLVPSIRSYYDHVDQIVASYDQDFHSWSGLDMGPEMRGCIRLLQENDPAGKVTLLPGPFSCPGEHPQLGETRQRQASLVAAADFGEWVVQLDTDEIAHQPERIVVEIKAADRDGCAGLEYPARWIYTHISRNWFLEAATRRMSIWSAIPGPVAVRAGTTLRRARQVEVKMRQLRFGSEGGGRVRPIEAILHFSMVRSSASMRWKADISSHAPDLDWGARLALWEEACAHPTRAVLRSVIAPRFGSYRPVRLPAMYGNEMVAEQTLLGDPDRLRSSDEQARGA
ncbi:MAG: hypothetical protein QOI95_310 [Acidimicrobiaceae bacterium]|jgi:hypothetical protein